MRSVPAIADMLRMMSHYRLWAHDMHIYKIFLYNLRQMTSISDQDTLITITGFILFFRQGPSVHLNGSMKDINISCTNLTCSEQFGEFYSLLKFTDGQVVRSGVRCLRDMKCTVMTWRSISSNPGRIELQVRSTSVLSRT